MDRLGVLFWQLCSPHTLRFTYYCCKVFVAVTVVRRNLFSFLLDDQFLILPFCKQTAGAEWCFQSSLNSELAHILGNKQILRWNRGTPLDKTGAHPTTPLNITGVLLPLGMPLTILLDETGTPSTTLWMRQGYPPPSPWMKQVYPYPIGWNKSINLHVLLCAWRKDHIVCGVMDKLNTVVLELFGDFKFWVSWVGQIWSF